MINEKSDLHEVTFTALTYGGDALARLKDGRAVFAPFALPGERALVRLVEEKRGHARAQVVELLQAASERIQPRCVHFGVCGGCHYQHMVYERQVEVKTAILREQLQRLAGIENPPVLAMIPDPRGWDYRSAAQFHLTPEGRVGYQIYGTAQPFAIQECHLLEDGLDEAWPRLDLEALPGLERVSLRLGLGEDILLALESADPMTPDLSLELPFSAVYLGPTGTVVMAGDDYTVMEVLGRRFKVSAGSFFQVNTAQAVRMVEHLLARLPLSAQTHLLDVYCGVGLFSAFLAARVGQLTGVERSSSACDDFAVNLDEFENVALYQGAAEDVLPGLDVPVDIAVVDPPRAGLERAALDAIVRMAPPAIAYVSCDPATLARDLKRLLAAGYRLEEVQPFDMFPQTYHIESVSLLRR